MICFGIRGTSLRLFECYLWKRVQCVLLNGDWSSWETNTCAAHATTIYLRTTFLYSLQMIYLQHAKRSKLFLVDGMKRTVGGKQEYDVQEDLNVKELLLNLIELVHNLDKVQINSAFFRFKNPKRICLSLSRITLWMETHANAHIEDVRRN